MRADVHCRVFGAATVAVAIAACGTSANHTFGIGGNSSGAGGVASGSTASGAGNNVFAGDGAPPVLSGPPGTPSDASLGDSFVGCATDTQRGKQLPLDLYVMLDTSGSMNDLVGPQRSKWDAVSAAITAFVNDPGSAGIGVGVQCFPKTALPRRVPRTPSAVPGESAFSAPARLEVRSCPVFPISIVARLRAFLSACVSTTTTRSAPRG